MRLSGWTENRSKPNDTSASPPQGIGVLELVLVLAIIGVMLAILVPRLTARPLSYTADLREFSTNLEVARDLAQGRTLEYRLRVVNPTQYVIERGALSDGAWVFSITERAVSLRSGVAFSTGSVGLSATFESRGRLVGTDVTFTLLDVEHGGSRQIIVHSTGMVEAQ